MTSTILNDRSWARSLTGGLSGLSGYGMAILATATALGLTFGLRHATVTKTLFLFEAAIFASIWFYGKGPGFLAATLSAVASVILLPVRPHIPGELLADFSERLPTIATFVICAFTAELLSTRRHRAEAALRTARDGLELTVLERTQALRAANKALSSEIEERRNAEAALRAGEKFWRTIFENSNVPMGMATVTGRDRTHNRAAQRLLGYSADELENLTIAGITHEDDRERTIQEFDKLRAGVLSDYHVVKRYRRKNGDVTWVDATVTRLPNPRSGEDLIFAIFPDITEQKRTEAELRASEERWRAMFQHAPVAIATFGDDYRLIETNPGCHRLLGYTEEELREMTPMDISFEADRDATRTLLPKLIEGTITAVRLENRYRARDGSAVSADATLFHVPRTEASPAFATAIVVDITERKRAEEALLRTQSELARAARVMTMGELTASIAHEVNQPLAAIVASGNACRRWLDTRPPNLERARESLGRMVADANRASDVIARIRALTRNALPEQVPVAINDIVRDVLLFVRGELDARRIELHLELGRDVSSVLGDKVQLQQVILNLTMNAVEALSRVMDRRRDLTIRTQSATTDEILVTVRDNGPGLEDGYDDRIFDTFFTTKPNGMGMGLSISRSIIEAHGGRLWALSELPHGAEFNFVLPIVAARQP
jgi:PAS domain S-box-containing protein